MIAPAAIENDAICIAGVGCRNAASGDDILAAVDAALAHYDLPRARLTALACIPGRAAHPGIAACAAALAIPVLVAEPAALAAAAELCVTRSRAALEATGLPSASEAAALAAACANDRDACLAGPRLANPMATCAIACSPAVLDHLDQQ